jgi:hypothetical protein
MIDDLPRFDFELENLRKEFPHVEDDILVALAEAAVGLEPFD